MNIQKLEKKLGHTFSDPVYVRTALRHSSYVNEQADIDLSDNERLEFLGDAALSLCISHLLFTLLPEEDEGILTQLRASLVNDNWLAGIARKLDLGHYIQLGKGEFLSNGGEKDSILAGAFEAIVGAIFLDGGLAAALATVEQCFQEDIQSQLATHTFYDFKSLLQERLQAADKSPPVYQIIEEVGPDHEKTFRCRVAAGSIEAEGQGRSKKAAQQAAAKKALAIIQNTEDQSSSDLI